MVKKRPYIIITQILCFLIFTIIFILSFSSCKPTQKRTSQVYDTLPPPPPMNENTLSEATLQKIESIKTLLGAHLNTVGFNGNKENDYLVKVMQLNYGAINNLSSARLGNTVTNQELNKQADYFLNAMDLVASKASKDLPSDTSVLKSSLQKKGLNEIKDELVQLSRQYKESGMDASILSFATKIIKENGKEN